MALKTFDGFATSTTGSVAAGVTTIPVLDSSICASLGTGNHTYLRIGDGTMFEWVKVIGCSANTLLLESPTQHAYPAGSCVLFTITSTIVCELIGSGACVAPPPTPGPCNKPVFVAGVPLPPVELEAALNHAIAWSGDSPFTVTTLIKPSWMTVTVSGNIALLGGTPPDDSEIALQILVQNACGSAEINTRLCYCGSVGV